MEDIVVVMIEEQSNYEEIASFYLEAPRVVPKYHGHSHLETMRDLKLGQDPDRLMVVVMDLLLYLWISFDPILLRKSI